jgi:hypothetical protein
MSLRGQRALAKPQAVDDFDFPRLPVTLLERIKVAANKAMFPSVPNQDMARRKDETR